MRQATTRIHVGGETGGRACSIYERTRPTKSSSTVDEVKVSSVRSQQHCVREPYPVFVELPIRETIQWVSPRAQVVELGQSSL